MPSTTPEEETDGREAVSEAEVLHGESREDHDWVTIEIAALDLKSKYDLVKKHRNKTREARKALGEAEIELLEAELVDDPAEATAAAAITAAQGKKDDAENLLKRRTELLKKAKKLLQKTERNVKVEWPKLFKFL